MTSMIRWDNVIKSYLEYYNDYYDLSFSGVETKPYHLLFVEGMGDCIFYNDFFKKLSNIKGIDCTILKKCILFDFSNRFSDNNNRINYIDDFGNIIYDNEDIDTETFVGNDELRKNKLITQFNELRDSINNAVFNPTKSDSTEQDYDNKYENFKFPAKCLEVYQKKNFDHINIFGIIDHDFGHDNEIYCDGKLIDNLIMSRFHDRETTLIRYSLQNYVRNSRMDIKPILINKIVDILIFTTKQGILEKSSFILNQIKNDPLYNGDQELFKDCYNKITAYTKIKFKENGTKDYPYHFKFYDYLFSSIKLNFHDPSLIKTNSLKRKFETYFKINETSHKATIAYNIYTSLINEIKRNFFDFCIIAGCDKDELSFDNKMDTIIKNWLNSSDKELDNDVINRVFEYSNGHYILQRLLMDNNNLKLFYKNNSFKDEDLLSNDNDSETNLLNLFVDILDNNDIDLLINASPLKEYIDYRINGNKNKLFLVEKQKETYSLIR